MAAQIIKLASRRRKAPKRGRRPPPPMPRRLSAEASYALRLLRLTIELDAQAGRKSDPRVVMAIETLERALLAHADDCASDIRGLVADALGPYATSGAVDGARQLLAAILDPPDRGGAA